jgi:hypothetical protein
MDNRQNIYSVRIPQELDGLIQQAAARELISKADYVRRAAKRSVDADLKNERAA